MKIYTKIRINIDTGETIEEEFYEYFGPMALLRRSDPDDPDDEDDTRDINTDRSGPTGEGNIDSGVGGGRHEDGDDRDGHEGDPDDPDDEDDDPGDDDGDDEDDEPKSAYGDLGNQTIPGLTGPDGKPMTFADLISGRFNIAEDTRGEMREQKTNWENFARTYTQRFKDIGDKYDAEIAGIPKLNVRVGSMFGGGRIPMAPGKHVAVAGDKAKIRAGLVGEEAGIASTSLGNIDSNIINRYKVGHKQYDDPIQEALDIFSLDKTLANKKQIAELEANTQKDIKSGSIWDLIPAIAFGAGSL